LTPGALAARDDDALDRAAASRAPWLAPFAPAVRALAERDPASRIDWLNARARAADVRNAARLPIVFAPADDACGAAYEAHIHGTGRVPTRAATSDSAHDLFNALVWLRFPRAKAALNARQAAVIAQQGVQPTRGAARDAATLIDENALVLACRGPQITREIDRLLAAHDWPALFLRERAAWHATVVPHAFGHALLDKLVRPYKALTAHAIVLDLGAAADDAAAVDDALAAWLAGPALTPRALRPLPVLGIPGWWPGNEAASFYADATVFRPARASQVKAQAKAAAC
jgi:hypothetical protein